jgi:hypothetical protein
MPAEKKQKREPRSTALLVLLATLEFVGNILGPKEVLLLEH